LDTESLFAVLGASKRLAAGSGFPTSCRNGWTMPGESVLPQKLVDNMAEAWRVSTEQARAVLEEAGSAGSSRGCCAVGASAANEVEADPLSRWTGSCWAAVR
jgi:hypothetical protein